MTNNFSTHYALVPKSSSSCYAAGVLAYIHMTEYTIQISQYRMTCAHVVDCAMINVEVGAI